jgi:hypothetical protein
MTHRYTLQPTPDTHHLWDRPWYHEIRDQLLAKRGVMAPEPTPNLVDFTAGEPPIRDQGQEGSCEGHQERNVRRLAHWLVAGASTTYDFSPAFAYYMARAVQGTQTQDSGASIGNGLASMEENGICEETLMPYDPGNFATAPSSQATENALTHRAELQAVPVDYSSFANVHQVLADRHPVIGGFTVPPSFENCGADGALPDPTGEENLGGHAFSVCAVNLADGWMCDPNSWGTSWGKQGFAFMPASYLGRVFELWAIVPVL